MGEIVYSKYQKEIFKWVKEEQGNVVIEAIAGSGKTSTIKELVKLIPQDKRILLIAFNVSIVKELQEKINLPNVTIKTSHSLGYSYLKTHFKYSTDYQPLLEVDEYKYRNFFKKNFNELTESLGIEFKSKSESELFKDNILALIDLCRVYLCETYDSIELIADKYGYSLNESEINTLYTLIQWGRDNLETIDFVDMIALPNYLNLDINSLKYDWVLIDEIQDFSTSMKELFQKSIKKKGRFCGFGDRKQTIMGFSGSNEQSFNELTKIPNTKLLPLSINYRCPKCIEKIAQKYVPQFQVRDDAPQGEINYNVLIKDIKDNSMVLCRNTSPLIELYFRLLKENRTCYIKGSDDIGKQLLNVIDKVETPYISCNLNEDGLIPQLYKKLFEIRNKVMQEKKLDIQDATTNSIVLKQYELINSIKALSYNTNNVFELKNRIEKIFSNNNINGISLSSCHKSKGLENDHVYILCPSLLPSKLVNRNWEIESEKCLEYVAFTRCKETLNFISENDFPTPNNSNDIDSIVHYLNNIESIIYNLYNKNIKIEQTANEELYKINNNEQIIDNNKSIKLETITENNDDVRFKELYKKKIMRFEKLLIGKNIEDSYEILNELGLTNTIRVTKENNNPIKITCDFQLDRINVDLENHIIKKINGFG